MASKRSDLPRASLDAMRAAGPPDSRTQSVVEFYWLTQRGRTLTRKVLPDGTCRITVYGTAYIGEGSTWPEAMADFRLECERDGIVF